MQLFTKQSGFDFLGSEVDRGRLQAYAIIVYISKLQFG